MGSQISQVGGEGPQAAPVLFFTSGTLHEVFYFFLHAAGITQVPVRGQRETLRVGVE